MPPGTAPCHQPRVMRRTCQRPLDATVDPTPVKGGVDGAAAMQAGNMSQHDALDTPTRSRPTGACQCRAKSAPGPVRLARKERSARARGHLAVRTGLVRRGRSQGRPAVLGRRVPPRRPAAEHGHEHEAHGDLGLRAGYPRRPHSGTGAALALPAAVNQGARICLLRPATAAHTITPAQRGTKSCYD